jgi:hypothetical protein
MRLCTYSKVLDALTYDTALLQIFENRCSCQFLHFHLLNLFIATLRSAINEVMFLAKVMYAEAMYAECLAFVMHLLYYHCTLVLFVAFQRVSCCFLCTADIMFS